MNCGRRVGKSESLILPAVDGARYAVELPADRGQSDRRREYRRKFMKEYIKKYMADRYKKGLCRKCKAKRPKDDYMCWPCRLKARAAQRRHNRRRRGIAA